MFLSKVPNCKNYKASTNEMPGPGYYERLGTNFNTSFMSAGNMDHKRSTSDSAPHTTKGGD
jgi:hypothetical protein